MALKKQNFNNDEEVAIFDEAVVYKRGEYWHFRLWLNDERKYARKSLRTRSRTTAIEKAKEAYVEIYANSKNGKKYFSITTKAGVEKYLTQRQKDVDAGLIVSGRHTTIKTHLQHWLNFIGKDTKLKELHRNDCEDYFYERMKDSQNNVKQVTIQNEQSTINACIKYLFKNNETHIDGFEFKKLPKVDRNNEAIRRATLSSEEYERVFKVMRSYCAKRKNKLDDEERIIRQIVRHYILIAANSGLRVGEQRQLCWDDIILEQRESNGQIKTLAKITIRAVTSKVRTSRIIYCRGGEYFRRLARLLKPKNDNDLIFSIDGKTMLSKRALLYHFHKIMELAEIENLEQRDIVPYSLRHFMITQRIMSGLNFKQIADMCGTSVTQIEKTYYHLNDEIRLTNALADYIRLGDGTIRAI